MKAVCYLRQSVDQADGIERQRTRTRALIEARGWEFAGEFVDNDISASKKRGEGTAWFDLLHTEADVVVAVDMDRLLRDVRDLGVLIDSGKKVVTVDGEIDLSTADGEFRATMLAAIARFEVRRKSERQKRANEQRRGRGEYVGIHRPFGFEQDGMTPRPEERAAIVDGFRAYVAGSSLASIAQDWNERGLTSGQGNPWRRDSVRAVLRNPRYVGRVTHYGQEVGDAAWEAFVDSNTWEAVQARVRGAQGRKTSAKHLLTGVAVCGVCGAPVQSGGNARRGVRGYRCSAALGHFARMAEPVEEFVDSLIAARLNMPDAVELIRAPEVPKDLEAEAAALRSRLESLAVEFADGDLTAAQLRVATERIRDRLTKVEASMADAGRARVLSDVIGAGDVYLSLPVERRRAIVRTLVTVRVYPPGRGTRTFRPESVEIGWV